jgi:hypothetical protein
MKRSKNPYRQPTSWKNQPNPKEYVWNPYQRRSINYGLGWLRPPRRKWDAPVSDSDDSSATVTEPASCPSAGRGVKLTRERLMSGLNCGAIPC